MKRSPRTGLRILGARGQPAVRRALIRYARWLREHHEFPIRVPVYLSPHETLVTMKSQRASASFFAPWDRNVEPYIRIATGDYRKLLRDRGRDNCLAAYLHSLSHEIAHYQQWIATGELWEQGVVQKASAMVRAYSRTVDHP